MCKEEHSISVVCRRLFGKWFLITVFIPLGIGFIFYYYFCPDIWISSLIDNETSLNMHASQSVYDLLVLRITKSYLLDFIWAFSFSNMLFLIMEDEKLWWLYVVLIPTSFGVALEVLQRQGFIGGVFDLLDILVEMCAVIVTIMLVLVKNGGVNE